MPRTPHHRAGIDVFHPCALAFLAILLLAGCDPKSEPGNTTSGSTDALADAEHDATLDAAADAATVDDSSSADCGNGCDVLVPGGDAVSDADAVADAVSDADADAVADGSSGDCGSGCDVLAPGGDVDCTAGSDATGPALPGDPCGPCNLDTYACQSGVLVCSATTPCPTPPKPTPLPSGANFAAGLAFLTSGKDAPQQGATTLVAAQSAVVRGRVVTPAGAPIPNAKVSVQGQTGFGVYTTVADGTFSLVVNGDAAWVVVVQAGGRLTAQRRVHVAAGAFAQLGDIALVAVDPVGTPVTLGGAAPAVLAEASVQTDADGSRRARVFFPAGTSASMTLPDGSNKALAAGTFRATEYTVGPGGPAAMPADLPPTSAYTYCVELSFDEAIAAGATRVDFDQPVRFSVDNFMGFPAGTTVPVGWYDRQAAAWKPGPDGVVLAMLGVDGQGLALLDLQGKGKAATATQLAAWGIDEAERKQLAATWKTGESFWHVAIDHLTPWDCNWGVVPPAGAGGPGKGGPNTDGKGGGGDDPCYDAGSLIACESQALGESLTIPGTGLELTWWSDRVTGRKAAYTARFTVTDASPPAPLDSVVATLEIAGQSISKSYGPAANQQGELVWDGKDAFGRELEDAQLGTLTISYRYVPVVASADNTGSAWATVDPSLTISGTPARGYLEFSRSWPVRLGVQRHRALGPRGWAIAGHNRLVLGAEQVVRGAGGVQSLTAGALRVLAGQGNAGSPDPFVGQDAKTAKLHPDMTGIAISPDGTVLFGYSNSPRTYYRVTAEGLLEKAFGGGTNKTEGAAATDFSFSNPKGTAFAADGSLYVADYTHLRRIDAAGKVTIFAGNGATTGAIKDGVKATESRMNPFDVAVGPGGEVYAMGEKRVRVIGTDGIIQTFAGGGGGAGSAWTVAGAAAIADKSTFGNLTGIDVDAAGNVALADSLYRRVGIVDSAGIIRLLAGTGQSGLGTSGSRATDFALTPNDVAFGPDGGLFVADAISDVIVYVDPQGNATIVVGTETGNGPACADGLLGRAVDPINILTLDCDASGRLVFGDKYRLFELDALAVRSFAGNYLLPSDQKGAIDRFDKDGRHQDTVHHLTGRVLRSFAYDSEGRLASVTDEFGGKTTIDRDSSGALTAIVAPDGRKTTVGVASDETLTSLKTPAGNTATFGYASGALMTSYKDAAGGSHAFTYDADGRLATDTDPDGRKVTLTGTDVEGGRKVVQTLGSGRTTTFTNVADADGKLTATRVEPSGAKTVVVTAADGLSRTLQHANGGSTTVGLAPDPLWGMTLAYAASLVSTMPGGGKESVAIEKTATLDTDKNPAHPATWSSTVTVDGKATSFGWERSGAVWTLQSPSGAGAVWKADSAGRLASESRSGAGAGTTLSTVSYSYDSAGRLATFGPSGAATTVAYDAGGRVKTLTAPTGESRSFAYDDDDGVQTYTDAASQAHAQAYSSGLLQSVARPAGGKHAFAYTAASREKSWTLPDGSATFARSYDADGWRKDTTLPGGASFSYSAGATDDSPTGITDDAATIAITVQAGSALPATLVRTPKAGAAGIATAQTLASTWDGALLTAQVWSGVAVGSFSYPHGSDLRPDALAWSGVGGGSGAGSSGSWALTWDADGALASVAGFTVERKGPGGAATALDDGSLKVAQSFDTDGRLTGRSVSVGGSVAASLVVVRDAAGRVKSRSFSVGGSSFARSYTYDGAGRLGTIGDGSSTTTFAYDSNDNLVSATTGGSVVSGSFDAADRLKSWAGSAVTTSAAGYVTARGGDAYVYSARGQLLEAKTSAGTVTYAYDGIGRRVGRSLGGKLTQYLYGDPKRLWLVTHVVDSAGAVTALLYDEAGALFALERGGKRYGVLSDDVGTPWAVVDSTGALVDALTWSAHGAVVSESAPAFGLPIGFAGGLRDDATGLLRFWLRDLDPLAGRWMALDPSRFAGLQPNLYVYVGNDPVNRLDPTGLVCFEANYYAGYGGGAQVCLDGDGYSVCGELGFGLGGGAEVDLFGSRARTGRYVGAEVMVQDGPVGLGGGVELDDCGRVSGGIKCELAVIKCQSKGLSGEGEVGTKIGPDIDTPEISFPKFGVKAQGKVYGKVCGAADW